MWERIAATFDEYVSFPAFEQICQQFTWRAYRSSRFPKTLEFDAVGSWWSGRHQIDIVAQDRSRTTLVGSCKWTNAPVGLAEYRALQQNLAECRVQLRPADDCWLALFSREGFTEDLVARSLDPNERLLLARPEDMFF